MTMEDAYGVLITMVVVSILIFCGHSIRTNEYTLETRESCVAYALSTGDCSQKSRRYVVTVDNWFKHINDVVFECGTDIEKCNEALAHFQENRK